MTVSEAKKELRKRIIKKKVPDYQRFFKTGKGQYGEGDIFLGVTVPKTREVAKMFSSISLEEIKELLESKYHEDRLLALLILVQKFEKNKESRRTIADFYLSNLKGINNWDLVDLSAHKILGRYFYESLDYDEYHFIIFELARSNNLWERRIAVLTTAYFISKGRFREIKELAEMLLNDEHDLMHKAIGWMLREVGKRDINVLEKFLRKNYKDMPRTMLRYSIEKFPEEKRKAYLKGEIK